MTDDKRIEGTNAREADLSAADPALRRAEPGETTESTLPVEGGSTAPEPPADPAPAETSPAGPAPADPAPAEPSPGPSEPEAQSKFAGPASTLGIRPQVEQSKAGSGVPGGLGPVAASARPSAPPAPAPLPPPALPPNLPPPGPSSAVAPPAGAPPGTVPPSFTAPFAPGRPSAATPAALTSELDEDEPVPTWAERLRRLSPALVTLSIGSIGALIFLLVAMTSHTTPVAVLLSAGVVVTLAFAADAVIASMATWRAAVDDEDPGRALLLAVLAGGSAVICAGALGATTVLLFVLYNL
jgi:hypothetical protein